MTDPARDIGTRWFTTRTLPCLLVLAALAVGATPKVVGDGDEYSMYAVAMSLGRFPPLSAQDLEDARRVLARTDERYESWDPATRLEVSASGRGDFVHFWFYPAMAVPGTWLARLVGVSPAWSFVLLNVLLLLLAWHLSVGRFGWAVSLLVCGGPILWWVDKVHTEAFTFALLTIAVASLSARPWLSLVALGAAATQNPPISALLVLFGAAGLWLRRGRRDRRATLLGMAGGVALAAVHPAYYLLAYGRPSLIASASRGVLPNLSEFGAVLWDSNIGLVFGHPMFLPAVVCAAFFLLAVRPRLLLDPELAAAAVAVPILMFAFAQTANFQHGGTPGISRYALWLLPLTMRLFDLARPVGRADVWVRRWAVLSFAGCLVAYHPSVAEKAYRPSYATRWIWPAVPGLVRPLPEVFSETVRGDDGGIRVPVALPGCQKVLIQAGGRSRAMWPVPCYPAVVPVSCMNAGTFCYANLASRGYVFDVVPRPYQIGARYSSSDTWGQDAEPTVRRLLDGADWLALRAGSERADSRFFRHAENVTRVWDLQSDHAFVLAAKGMKPGARAFVRLPRPMEGPIVDGDSGVEVGRVAFTGTPSELFGFPLPESSRIVLVVLR